MDREPAEAVDYRTRKPYTLWMIADYGGGSPTGGIGYNEDALPEEYRGNGPMVGRLVKVTYTGKNLAAPKQSPLGRLCRRQCGRASRWRSNAPRATWSSLAPP